MELNNVKFWIKKREYSLHQSMKVARSYQFAMYTFFEHAEIGFILSMSVST